MINVIQTHVMKQIRTQKELDKITKKSAGMAQETLEMLLRKGAALSRSKGQLLDSDHEDMPKNRTTGFFDSDAEDW